jgi:hypothetical protein
MISFKPRSIYVLQNRLMYPWKRNPLSVRKKLDVVMWRKLRPSPGIKSQLSGRTLSHLVYTFQPADTFEIYRPRSKDYSA